MSETAIREVLIRFFEQEFGLPPETHDRTATLFSSGLLDSFALAIVLAFLHERFDASRKSTSRSYTHVGRTARIRCSTTLPCTHATSTSITSRKLSAFEWWRGRSRADCC